MRGNDGPLRSLRILNLESSFHGLQVIERPKARSYLFEPSPPYLHHHLEWAPGADSTVCAGDLSGLDGRLGVEREGAGPRSSELDATRGGVYAIVHRSLRTDESSIGPLQ